MGLDMYLMAEQRVEKGTPKHEAITQMLGEKHLEDLADHDMGHSTYVSGWDFGEGSMRPDGAYGFLVKLTGMQPDPQSPHFYVDLDGEDYLVRAGAAYWRKANAIHEWFVANVQDGVDECQLSDPIHGEVLAGLVETCKEVLETPVLAAKLLPTQSGFFFGSVDYDEWYIHDLEETVRRLTEIFETYPKPLVLRYQSSW